MIESLIIQISGSGSGWKISGRKWSKTTKQKPSTSKWASFKNPCAMINLDKNQCTMHTQIFTQSPRWRMWSVSTILQREPSSTSSPPWSSRPTGAPPGGPSSPTRTSSVQLKTSAQRCPWAWGYLIILIPWLWIILMFTYLLNIHLLSVRSCLLA